jgi:hypothetical protein
MEVRIHDRLAPHTGDEVDARLVRLAKAMRADIVTNDYNLNRVAEVQGVRVLNINELAEAVRIHVLPGEDLTVIPIREGQEPDQGIAYLEDGTMVVVEGGRDYLNQAIDVVVTSVLQSARGKMLFAEPKTAEGKVEGGIDYSTALILAAGNGVRFGKGDKLWQPLHGVPVWRHAVWRLLSHSAVESGTLAVAPDNAAPFEAYLRRYPAPKPLRVLPCGGATRQATVRNALAPLAQRRALRGGA